MSESSTFTVGIFADCSDSGMWWNICKSNSKNSRTRCNHQPESSYISIQFTFIFYFRHKSRLQIHDNHFFFQFCRGFLVAFTKIIFCFLLNIFKFYIEKKKINSVSIRKLNANLKRKKKCTTAKKIARWHRFLNPMQNAVNLLMMMCKVHTV